MSLDLVKSEKLIMSHQEKNVFTLGDICTFLILMLEVSRSLFERR